LTVDDRGHPGLLEPEPPRWQGLDLPGQRIPDSTTSILIVGNLYDDPIPKITTTRLASLLTELRCVVGYISGESFLNQPSQTTRLTKFRVTESIVGLTLESAKRQIGAVARMRQRNFDVGIVMLSFLMLPCLYVKMRGKSLWIYAGGRASKSIAGEIQHGSPHRWPAYILMRIVEHLSFGLADRIIVEARAGARFLGLEKYGDKLAIGGQCVDTHKFTVTTPLRERKQTVGYVGGLKREKGVAEFLQAAAILASKRNDIDFTIVGTGPLAHSVADFVSSNRALQSRVRLIGWAPRDLIPDILNELSLLVLPSYSEGLPSIVLEAMACGTPVLASRVGAIPEILIDSSTGFLLDDTDPGRTAESIERVLGSGQLERVAKNAAEAVEKEYSVQAALSFYAALVGKPGDQPAQA